MPLASTPAKIFAGSDRLRPFLKMQAQAAGKLPVCYHLHSLEGALTNRHWDDVPAATKALLLKDVGRA